MSLRLSRGDSLDSSPETRPGGKVAPGLRGHLISREELQIWIFRFIAWFLIISNSCNILDNHVQPNRKWLQTRCHLGEWVQTLVFVGQSKVAQRLSVGWSWGDFIVGPPSPIILAALQMNQNHTLQSSLWDQEEYRKHRQGRLDAPSSIRWGAGLGYSSIRRGTTWSKLECSCP